MTLVDTSAWIEALRTDGREEIRTIVARLLGAGQAALCPMVALELWNGAGGEAERAKVRRLVETLHSLAVTPDAWDLANAWARTARERGVTVPATDILIAATAETHHVELAHADRHFEMIRSARP